MTSGDPPEGCPIPPDGSPVTRAICCDDTWLGVVSELLRQSTFESFWERAANRNAVSAAMLKAEQIVGSFLSDDCSCIPAIGGFTHQVWDFLNSDGGWYPAGQNYGYHDSAGWHANIVQINANRWDARLDILFDYNPAVQPREAKATCFIQDPATTHIAASHAAIRGRSYFPWVYGEVEYGGDLSSWHVGPINPRFVVYTSGGVDHLEIFLDASYALDPSGVIDLRCTAAYFDHF